MTDVQAEQGEEALLGLDAQRALDRLLAVYKERVSGVPS